MASNCKAIQYSDQMQCAACGLAWDVNDPEPPRCAPTKPGRHATSYRTEVTEFRRRMSDLKRSLER